MISSLMVQDAARALVDSKLERYLANAETAHGRAVGSTPRVRPDTDGRVCSADVTLPETNEGRRLPFLVAVCSGTDDTPRRNGRAWEATWALDVIAIVGGKSRQDTLEHAQLYGTALRDLFLREPDLGGLALGTDWAGEDLTEYAWSHGQTLRAASCLLTVQTPRATDLTLSPLPEGATDEVDDPTVLSVDFDVEGRPIHTEVPA